VVSHADGVDPVGACVGPRGSRVRMVVSELRGEKIDIIPYNDEPARFVAKALSPARVREVLVDDDGRRPPSSCPTTSSRWPSAARARTRAWPPA
jgi:N utilization substance protein A